MCTVFNAFTVIFTCLETTPVPYMFNDTAFTHAWKQTLKGLTNRPERNPRGNCANLKLNLSNQT